MFLYSVIVSIEAEENAAWIVAEKESAAESIQARFDGMFGAKKEATSEKEKVATGERNLRQRN